MEKAREYWEAELADKAENTRANYRRYLSRFLEWADWTHEELYQRVRNGQNSEDPREGRLVEFKVRNYMKKLVDEGVRPGTANLVYMSVKAFLDANCLSFEIKQKDRPRVIYQGQRIIRAEQIHRVLDNLSIRNKKRNRAVVLLAKDTGLRASDIIRLDVEDILGAEVVEDGGEKFMVLRPLETTKTGDIGFVHLGPESVAAVTEYIGDRKRGPLLLGENGRRLGRSGLSVLFSRMCAGLEDGDKVSLHSFRKFHKTKLQSVMPEKWVLRLQGKAVDAYTKPEQSGGKISDLAQAYIDGYDALRIFKAPASDEELRELRRQVEALQAERDQLATDVRRVPELKDRIASLETRVIEMSKAYEEFEELTKRVEEKLKKA